ncbi:hypothetical protein T4C_4872 [Trichinella pseudospiralis]|uniref:Uncharacterized protein n=1 Tax=Trichinella pseudospiralis TaxID=6337 RepID=A0A0V1J2Q5_TRIPS|nr:hypothetical protein T4C_4872 [Trichinella pseudospiralis]
MNRQAKKHHLISFELLQLLIDEQGSTLIQQLCITVLTAEYDGGTRTMEWFLKAVAYDVIEPNENSKGFNIRKLTIKNKSNSTYRT